jgi:type IV secretory pathway VirB6-like protein
MAGPVSGGRRPSGALVPVLRLGGAALLLATAVIHGYLWQQGYAGIDVVGPAFLANAVSGVLGAVLLLVVPGRWLPWVAAAGAALSAGTLAGLLLSTTVGLFGFVESTAASLWWESFWVDVAGTVVLAALALISRPRGGARGRAADDPAADGAVA